MSMIGYEKHKLFDDEAADLHPSYWWGKRRTRKQHRKAKKPFTPLPGTLPTLVFIANHEYLLHVFEEMKRKGGQAPGLDGLRYDDFSRSEIAAYFRKMAKVIRNGTYRPQPYRAVLIPKEDGTSRELRLRNIIDRVVAGAIYRALLPYFEPLFLDCSYGFRASPDACACASAEQETFNTWRLLAELELTVNKEQRYVLVIDDVRKAFDNVNIDIVLAILAKPITEHALLRLIEVVLRGGDDEHNIGIDQGSPLSPLILNILLDEIHDQPLHKEDTNLTIFRYADNLTDVCKTVEEGIQTLTRVGNLLSKASLTLKGKKDGHPVVDLRGEPAQLLGFTLSVKKDKLHLDLGNKAWAKLAKDLREAYETRNPSSAARQTMTGWLQAHGPALHHQAETTTLERILQTAADLGFHEDISIEELKKAWGSARRRWGQTRRDARQRYEARNSQNTISEDADEATGSAAATPPGATPHAGGPVSQESEGVGAPPTSSPLSAVAPASAGLLSVSAAPPGASQTDYALFCSSASRESGLSQLLPAALTLVLPHWSVRVVRLRACPRRVHSSSPGESSPSIPVTDRGPRPPSGRGPRGPPGSAVVRLIRPRNGAHEEPDAQP